MWNQGAEHPWLKAPWPSTGLSGGTGYPSGAPAIPWPCWPRFGWEGNTRHLPQLVPRTQEVAPAPHPSFGGQDEVGAQTLGRERVVSSSLWVRYIISAFFFLIFIFIYIDIYIYTHLVTQKEKKNRIRNNNNKKKYSGLKTIHSYHARRAIDCTRPTSGWPSRDGAGAGGCRMRPPKPPVPGWGGCRQQSSAGRGRAAPLGCVSAPQVPGRGGEREKQWGLLARLPRVRLSLESAVSGHRMPLWGQWLPAGEVVRGQAALPLILRSHRWSPPRQRPS